MIRPIGTVRFVLAWLNPWMPAFTASAKISNLKFRVSRRDVIGRHISKYGHHEPFLTAWIADHLSYEALGIVIDVGANIGWHSVHAARHKSVDTVVAFEPDAFNAWLLDQNLTLNEIDNVIVQACAVGDRNGVAKLHRYKSSNNGRHSLIPMVSKNTKSVPVVTLDDALASLNLMDWPILLIKIDVEGFEPAVISGASRALSRTSAIVTEFSPELSRHGGLSTSTMLSQILAEGFQPHLLSDTGNLISVEPSKLDHWQEQTDVIWLRENSGDRKVAPTQA